MPSPEQLKSISVPLQETELFTQPDHSGGLTPEGSILQRFVLFSHAISTEDMGEGVRQQYESEAAKDAVNLGISQHQPGELTSQWQSLLKERESRIQERFSSRSQQIPVFDALTAAGA